MPFKPDLMLQLKEAAFVKYIEAIERNTLEEHFSQILPAIKKIVIKDSSKLDAQQLVLIELYDVLTQFIQQSNEIKANLSAAHKAASMAHLKELIIRVHQQLSTLKSQADLWHYLSSTKAGRLVFYYFIYINLIHENYHELTQFTHELFAALKESYTSPCELMMVHFLHLRFCLFSATDDTGLSIKTKDNLFIKAYQVLDNLKEYTTIAAKKEAIVSLYAKPLEFSDTTPGFIKQFVLQQYTVLFVAGMGSNADMLEQVEAVQDLAILGYLPAITSQEGNKSLHCVHIISALLRAVYHTMYSFSLFNDPNLLLRSWYTQLMFFQVFAYYHLMHSGSQKEIKTIQGQITQRELSSLLNSAINLLKLKQPQMDMNVELQERFELFWRALKMIFCTDLWVDAGYIEVLSNNIDLIINAFAAQNRFIDVCDIVASVVELQNIYCKLPPQDYRFYSNLVKALHFIRDLPSPSSDDLSRTIAQFLKHIQEQRYHFKLSTQEIKNKHPIVHHMARGIFLKQLAVLVPCVTRQLLLANKAAEQYHFLLQLVRDTFSVPNDEFSALCTPYYEMEEWNDNEQMEQKKEPLKKQKKSKKSRSFAASSSASLFFKPADSDSQLIPCTAIPPAIWDFALFITQYTKKPLILVGSAAAFLYLKMNNPRDYDFVLLNIAPEDLLELLQQHGYKAQQAGRSVPVIKLQLAVASGMLDLDLTIEQVESEQPLTHAMKLILAKRDFNVSALFTVLQPEASSLEVKGIKGAISSINQKLLRVVNHDPAYNLFIEDPIRLFRLVKNCLQYPEFKMDVELTAIVEKTKINFKGFFYAYLNHAELFSINRGKVSTALENLFERFTIASVLKQIDDLGLFTPLFDLNYEDLEPCIHLLQPYEQRTSYEKKKAVNYFLHMQYTVLHADVQKINSWPFYSVIRCVKPDDRNVFNTVEALVLNNKSIESPLNNELNNWLIHMQDVHKKLACC